MQSKNYMLMWVGLGLAIGAGLGVVFDNIPIGVGLGLVFGAGIGLNYKSRNQPKDE